MIISTSIIINGKSNLGMILGKRISIIGDTPINNSKRMFCLADVIKNDGYIQSKTIVNTTMRVLYVVAKL